MPSRTCWGRSGPTGWVATRVTSVMFGGPGNDTFEGLGGHDELVGEGGADEVVGGQGPDFLFGRQGDDDLLGQEGDDRAYGGPHVSGDMCEVEFESGCEL